MGMFIRVDNGVVTNRLRHFEGEPPVLSPKKGMRWVPYTKSPRPAFDDKTQRLGTTVKTLQDDAVVESHPVEDLPASEIKAREDGQVQAAFKNVQPLMNALSDGSFVPGATYTEKEMLKIVKDHL